MSTLLWKIIRDGIGTGVTALGDFALPPRCPATGAIVDAPGMLSAQAWEGMRFIAAPQCACCGLPFDFDSGGVAAESLCLSCERERPPFASARAALAYDDGSRDLILRFKHADQTHVVHSFIPWLRLAGRDMLAQADVIVPVPLHRWRLLKRRYNQAGLLAQLLARTVGKPFLPDTLQRRRATASQGHMGAKARHRNVKRAFVVPEAKKAALAGKNVVLVDDVYTTGATVNACTQALLAGGAQAVHVLTVARVLRD
jgi:ComF family protein